MTPDALLCLAFATATVTTYVLWCLEVLPRLRLLLVLIGVVCFAIAISMRTDLFAAHDTKPAVPNYRDLDQ